MPQPQPVETSRTAVAGFFAILSALGMTGILTQWFTALGWVEALIVIGRIGEPLLIAIYGACATILSHHLTHHPRGILVTLAHTILVILGIWALLQGTQNSVSLLLGVCIGLAWLHWIHNLGKRAINTPSTFRAVAKNRRN